MPKRECPAMPSVVHEMRWIEPHLFLHLLDPLVDGRSRDAILPGDLSLGRRITDTENDLDHKALDRGKISRLMAVVEFEKEVDDPDELGI